MRPDRSTLPSSLTSLYDLATNLRWSWHAPTQALFEELDPTLWAHVGEDAWRMLAELPPARLEAAAADAAYAGRVRAAAADLASYLDAADTWFLREAPDSDLRVAYLSAEFGLVAGLRIYSGGLGVLAGDHLKSASDLGVPLTAIGLFYREGYFTQRVDALGRQQDVYEPADPVHMPMTEVTDENGGSLRILVPIADREVSARVWRVDVGRVPLYLLDTDVSANSPADRRITDRLYSGDESHRIDQELVLGIGGVRLLEVLELGDAVLHLNEGHAAFAALERARTSLLAGAHASTRGYTAVLDALVRTGRSAVFTTHTPVEAGHDYFPPALVESRLGPYLWGAGIPLNDLLGAGRVDPADAGERFCMTILAMHGASRRNAVSKLHGEVSRAMWADLWPDREAADVPIAAITNGVHMATWVAPETAALYTAHVGESWTEAADRFHWRGMDEAPDEALWTARTAQRHRLVDVMRRRLFEGRGRTRPVEGEDLDPEALTIVFARRFATYKRATLLLRDIGRLESLVNGPRPVQFVFAGKAHPRDQHGQDFLRRIALAAERTALRGRFVFLEEYDVHLARALVQGADVWLNVPTRPREASGTSGMKAAANGALNLSIADGWWAEAWTEHNELADPIGWVVGDDGPADDEVDAESLMTLLESEVVPLFHERDAAGRPAAWLRRVRATMRQVPPFFSTHRMVQDYVRESYLPAAGSLALGDAAGAHGD